MSLKKIKGQQKAVNQLKRYVESSRIPHAFIFYGISGIGKFRTALGFARYVNCLNGDENCPGCPSCLKSDKCNHPDLTVTQPLEGKKSISIDQIRNLILTMRYAPMEGRFKISIIDDAEKLNIHSSNALLKTLEEPPPNAIIILVTSNIRTIQPTILSRCALIKFNPLSDDCIREILSEESVFENIDAVMKLSEGSAGKALSLVSGNYLDIRNSIMKLFESADSNFLDPIELSEFIMENHSDYLEEVFDALLFLNRDMISIKKDLPRGRLFNSDIVKLLEFMVKALSLRKIFDDSALIYSTRNAIFHSNANAKIALDNMFLNISYGSYKNR